MNHSMMAVAVIFFMADGSHLVYHSENGGWQKSVIVFLSIREWRMADECHSIPKDKSSFSIS